MAIWIVKFIHRTTVRWILPGLTPNDRRGTQSECISKTFVSLGARALFYVAFIFQMPMRDHDVWVPGFFLDGHIQATNSLHFSSEFLFDECQVKFSQIFCRYCFFFMGSVPKNKRSDSNSCLNSHTIIAHYLVEGILFGCCELKMETLSQNDSIPGHLGFPKLHTHCVPVTSAGGDQSTRPHPCGPVAWTCSERPLRCAASLRLCTDNVSLLLMS